MGIVEIIGKLVIGVFMFVILAYLWGLFADWLSKSTNSNISYHGKIVSRPHRHDENMNDISEAKDKIILNATALINKIKSIPDKKMTVAEKIKALKDLEELKNENLITQEEYLNFKSKLM